MRVRRGALLAATGAAALALAGAAHGQWQVEDGPAAGDIEAESVQATATNSGGYRFTVFRDAGGVVRASFRLRPGLDRLDTHVCPTFFVDDSPPRVARFDGETCRAQARAVSFPLGRVEESEIRSDALLNLMNGSRLFVRFRLEGVGYGETEFSLRGSKQTLNRAIGNGVIVVAQ